MKQVDDALSLSKQSVEAQSAASSSVLAPEAWDRRERDTHFTPALTLLERAARHLIFDQMKPDRTYLPGAQDAVELLWNAMLAVEDARMTRERVERLSSIWLPQQIFARTKGSGPASH